MKKSLSRHYKNMLMVIFFGVVAAFVLLTLVIQQRTENYAIKEAEKQVMDALLSHRAVHKYVNTVSRPEMYRLKAEGLLYEDYFSPKTMSFTYTARGIKDFLNDERKKEGLPEIYFKLASSNPRNEINRADPFESELLKNMNEGKLQEFRQIEHSKDGSRSLFVAIPTKPITKGCLKCHGEPQDAPKEMVKLYPEAAGYHEEVGDIRALISIRIPLESHIRDAQKTAYTIIATLALNLIFIFLMIWFFMHRIKGQQDVILETNEQLQKLSATDHLTKVHNRLGFFNQAEKLFEVGQRSGKPVSLIMIDIDYFKPINDTWGHKAGDRVLQQFARLIQSRLRLADVFSRFGGEEFVILTSGQSIDQAEHLAETLRQKIEHETFDHDIKITASFGVAQQAAGESLSKLISQADKAMYQAKKAGRNQVKVYRPDSLDRVRV